MWQTRGMVDGRLCRNRWFSTQAAVLLGAAAFVPAQQSPAPAPSPSRIAHVVRVCDAAGAPVAGAEVTLAAGASYTGCADGDFARGTTGPDGRARLQILATLDYTAWAISKEKDRAITTGNSPIGSPVTELRFASPAAAAVVGFAVRGTEAWKDAGPLRLEVITAGRGIVVYSGPLTGDGNVVLPPSPGALAVVRVFAGEACVYDGTSMLAGGLELPPPQKVPVTAVDEAGKPVAGVSLFRVHTQYFGGEGPFPIPPRSDRLPAGTTGADGRAVVLVASSKDPLTAGGYPPFLVIAAKGGCRETYCAAGQSLVLDGELAEEGSAKEGLRLTMIAREPQVVRISAAEGTRPARILGFGMRTVPVQKQSFTTTEEVQSFVVDEAGGVWVPAQAGQHQWRAFVVPWTPPQLAADDPFRRVVVPRPLVVSGAGFTKSASLDLTKVALLRLQVLDATAGPAAGATVLWVPRQGKELLDAQFCPRATTDSAGRVLLPVLPPGGLVVVVHGDAFAKMAIDSEKLKDPVVLSVQPMERMKVRVVDGEGAPIAGARFSTHGASWFGGGDEEQQFLTNLGYQLDEWQIGRARTDKDGRAELPLLPSRWMQIQFVVSAGERNSSALQLVAGEECVEIEVK